MDIEVGQRFLEHCVLHSYWEVIVTKTHLDLNLGLLFAFEDLDFLKPVISPLTRVPTVCILFMIRVLFCGLVDFIAFPPPCVC